MIPTKKTKICFVSGVISRSGGTERVGTIIANSLIKRGYDVYILSFWNQGKSYFNIDTNIHVDYLLEPKKEGKLYRTYLYPIIKLHRYLKNNDIDILIDIDTVLSIYSSYAIRGTKCKLISWEHFNYWTMLRLKEQKRFRAKKLIKKYASKLVVLTNQDKNAHISHLDFKSNQVISIANPVTNIFDSNYNFDNNTFIAVGRLVTSKGFDILLDAWRIVEDNISNWNLIIIGSGEDENLLKERSKNLNLKNVIFVPHTLNIDDYYSNASAYVLSSRYEGFPMVLLEAESHGLPIISFDCKTGPRDLVINDINGYLVKNGDVELLAQKMIEFTNEKELAIKMSKKSKEIVSQFDIDSITDKWDELIKETLDI